jgi:hypothetical protein
MVRKLKSTPSDVKIPPSLSDARKALAPDETEAEGLERQHQKARIERKRELKKKRDTRKRRVEAAMRSLPLLDKATSQVSAFASAIEATYYNPGNGLSAAMRDTAAFAYGKLTDKPIESSSFEQFLKEIFRAYEIEAHLSSPGSIPCGDEERAGESRIQPQLTMCVSNHPVPSGEK